MTFAAATLTAYLSGQTADTTSTLWRLRSPAFTEGNRLLPRGRVGIALTKGVVAAATAVGTEFLLRHGHRRWALAIRVAGAGVGVAAAVHNLKMHERSGR